MPDTYSPRDMLERLVAFPTVSRNSNLDLIGFVKDYLGQFGIQSTLVYDDTGEKADLYATIGPKVAGGVVLSGHTDVVPVDGQDWSSDPFRLAERHGRLYGRGTADMKGFSAINLALVPEMLAAGLTHPIHLALSYDEEVGCLGAPRMIADMTAKLPPARAVIVGEPTLMKVVTEQKGILQFDCAVRGRSVHSSQCHLGVSAVTVAARLIARLDDMMLENARLTQPQPVFDPPCTTIHCGTVQGGTAHNIVARDAVFSCDIRTVTGEDPRAHYEAFAAHVRDEVEPALRARAPEAGITLTVNAYVPGLGGRGGEAERLARMLTGDNGLNGVAYATEAGQFEERGHSVVVCGPGSIDQAHQADEFIAIEEVEKGTAFVRDLIGRLC